MSEAIRRFENLPAKKRELALKLLKERAASATGDGESRIAKARPEEKREPSFSQTRLWFLCQIDTASVAYNLSFALKLSGALDAEALRKALDAMAERQESLRTSFADDNGRPVAVVAEKVTIPFKIMDISTDAQGGEPLTRKIIEDEARTPFNLGQAPLARSLLIRIGPGEHVFFFGMSHIISDAWTTGVLAKEISAFYGSFATGVPHGLAPLSIQYSDYAAWQRKRLSGERLSSLMDYWKKAMDGAPGITTPPADGIRPAVQTFDGKTMEFALGESLTKKLGALAARHEASLFMVLMAGFAALLSRLCGQEDVVIGYPIANRTFRETEPVAGFFVNTLLMRTLLDPAATFSSLIAQVRARALEAYERQELPFEKLVEELSPERSLSHSPLFQVMFVWDNTPSPEMKLGALSISSHKYESSSAHFDLTVGMRETSAGLLGLMEYNTALYSGKTIGRYIKSFQLLLENMADDPGMAVINAPMMDDARIREFLETCEGPSCPRPREGTVHGMFESAVLANRSVTAVESSDVTLTYENLNGRANRLARLLIEKGIGPDRVAGVMMRRSPEMMTTVLAILKAGGAYMPIDVEYPPARIAAMIQDSGASVIVTDTVSLNGCGEEALNAAGGNRPRIIAVDALGGSLEQYGAGNIGMTAGPENLAYVLYTSGSTGKPKGVAMPHRALANLMRWQLAQPGFKLKAKTLQFTTLTFDVSFQEIFSTWLTGGTLALMPDEARRDIPEVLRIIAGRGVERVFMPFVALRQMCESAISLGIWPSPLKEVITAGEQLRVTPEIAEFFRGLPGLSLVNHYGPTESHVVTSFTLPQNVADWPHTPPIGRPVSNCRIYILNQAMRPSPTGVYGEVHIGGAALAKGYLNNETLTRERFVADPFRNDGAMLYKTGDRARYLPDGNIEFSGRLDNQVKIRGHRIEPGEIEAALAACPGAGETAVIIKEEGQGDRRLAAFYTSKNGGLSPSSAKEYLKARLPEYMIPSSVTALESLPMTPSGKIDRKALAAMETEHAAQDTGGRPLAPAEEIMAGIWTELLGTCAIGAQSNFFELGGHSLLATRLVSRIKSAFSTVIELRAVFENQTLAALCRHVAGTMAGCPGGLPPITVVKRSGPVPLSSGQERLWFEEQMEGPSPKYNMASCLKLAGRLDVAAVEKSVNEIVRRHETLRTAFTMVDGEPMQVIARPSGLSMPVEDLSAMPEQARREALKARMDENFTRPFDLAAGPLFRSSLVRLGDSEYALLLAMSHIISDGWSIGVFVREFCALYNAFSGGAPARLPPMPVQYADFAAWQRGWLDGPVMNGQLQYWKERLAGAPELFALPSARQPSSTGKTPAGGFVPMRIEPDMARALIELGHRFGASLFMTMLAAFGTLLARHSGAEDIVIGTPIANRNTREVEDLIGFFVNMLPLRLDFSGDPEFSAMVARTRDTALGAFANQDAPFGELVRVINPKRESGRHPLFQVVFVMQNAPAGGLELDGITAEAVAGDTILPKYDLLFSFAQGAGGELHGVIEYNADMYGRSLVETLAAHYMDILGQAAKDPATRLYDFTIGAHAGAPDTSAFGMAGENNDDFQF
ncbi:MAG: amino acid adenylation domain-containing protein [Nitrospinae bacterium]|nr:amino acid adenylation domain-containing protein [Nitrospinota bacterium]